ncbi:hypothetical protein [Paenibacillus sp. S150]|uniref:hypothetical protein n=1 Tax=Paenibacillus sp. S150 TaxID=2749826 RepID=UPI001C59715E|nr:hypothetical protein [Paenibacillus sp. S150]MBW4082030.1 hypothetical protein [Paenibacillus sp. S150]
MKKITIAPSYIFYPQPIYVIGTPNEDGSANFNTSTWPTIANGNSPHIMMTIAGNKRTSKNLGDRVLIFFSGLVIFFRWV